MADLATLMTTHRKTIIIIGVNLVVAVVLIVGATALMKALKTKHVPDPVAASPAKVADFLAEPDIVRRTMDRRQQREFLHAFVNDVQHKPQRRTALLQELQRMPVSKQERVRDAFIDLATAQLVADSDEYRSAGSPQARKDQARRTLQQFEDIRQAFRGTSSDENVAVATDFSKSMPDDSQGLFKLMLERSSPSDRAKMETFVQELRDTYYEDYR